MHPITKIHNDADINMTNVLKALSSTFPIIYFLGMIITPTCKYKKKSTIQVFYHRGRKKEEKKGLVKKILPEEVSLV